ncbi:MAG: hypothetical protein M0T84_16555 [Betaproteobacteria bacterium]|nr:hypothetical protein [Betaproteobacteria bacterium]
MSQTMQSQYKRVVLEHNHETAQIYVHASRKREPYADWWKGRAGVVRFHISERDRAMDYAMAIAPIVHTQAGSFYGIEEVCTGERLAPPLA